RSGVVASIANEGRARVPVHDQLFGYHQTDRKLRLNSRASCATSTPIVARGQEHAHPGRKCQLRLTASYCLVAVVQNKIADSSAGLRVLTGMQRNKRVTELESWARGDRPLLRERVNPILAVPEPLKRLNVLHYSKFLVVSLFDQEAVVLNRG